MAGLFQSNTVVPTRYDGLRVNQALLGQPITLLWGTRRLTMRLLWYGDFTSATATSGGKKGGGSGGGTPGGGGKQKGAGGGKKGQGYVYSASIIGLLCFGNCQNLLSVWDSSGKFVVARITETFVVPPGGGTYVVQTPLDLVVSDQGPSRQDGYTVNVNDFGDPAGAKQLTGTQSTPLTLVAGSPGTGQYAYNPATATYTFAPGDAGKEIFVSYSAYRWVQGTEYLTVAAAQVTVENQPYFFVDLGVVYYPSGVSLTPVSGSPAHGQYNPNKGNYLFSAADFGAGIVISYSYLIPYANRDQNAPQQLNLSFVSGAKGQAPVGWMTSRHPTQALGYTQLAYIASPGLYLGFVPELPQYSFEITGLHPFGAGVIDACPSDCIEDILVADAFGLGFPAGSIDASLQGLARSFWTANSFFISPVLDGKQTAASAIGQWLEAGQVGCFWSEGLMKFVPYGTASAVGFGAQYFPPTNPLVSLGDSDYLAGDGEEPVKVSRSPWQDAYNRISVQWTPRINDYNSDVLMEQDDAAILRYGLRPESSRNYDFITELTPATFAANMRLQRNVYIRNTYQFRLSHTYVWLEPMDIIELNDSILGLVNTAVRILKIIDDPMKGLEITAEDFPWASGLPSLYVKQAPQPPPLGPGQQQPGPTSLILIETPNPKSITQGSILSMYATGISSQWGGCVLSRALGTTSCQNITQVQFNRTTGLLTITGANNVNVGDQVTFFNMNAAFLNGQKVTVASASSTQFTAQFYNYNTNYGPALDSGSAWAMTPFVALNVVNGSRIGVIAQWDNNLASGIALPTYNGANPEPQIGSSPAVMEGFFVDLMSPGPQLEGVSAAAATSTYPITLAAIITNGVAELLSYQNATLSSGSLEAGSRYLLQTLYRGLMGTTGAQHNVGDLFVRMDEASATFEYDPTLYGSTIFIAAQSFNLVGQQQQSLTDAVVYMAKLQGTEWVGGSVANNSYRPLSNPLTAHDAGSTATIFIAAFQMLFSGHTTINYNSGSIPGLSYGTTYYIYASDPALQGGNVTYSFSTTKETTLAQLGNLFIGSIITPIQGASDTTGNNDGGTGNQSGLLSILPFTIQPNVFLGTISQEPNPFTSGNGSVSNLQQGCDGDQTTAATLSVSGNTANNFAHAYFSGPPGLFQRFNSIIVKVLAEVPVNTLNGAATVAQLVLYNGAQASQIGSTLINAPAGVTVTKQIFSWTVPVTSKLNLTQLIVDALVVDNTGQTSGQVQLKIYECWIEAQG